MAKHLPATAWCTRITSDAAYQLVQTVDDEHVKLVFFPGNGCDGMSVRLTRRDARLLARRIGQCLDATKRR